MTHTNVQIRDLFDFYEPRKNTVLKDAELKFWRETAENAIRELENIPEAIEKYGYVTLPDGTKLVPEAQDAAAESGSAS